MKKKPTKMKFKLRKRNWLRGNPDVSQLLNYKGKMCCIGQLAKQCGIKKIDLLGAGAASALSVPLPEDMQWLVNKHTGGNTVESLRCYRINDSAKLTDAQRIARLRPIFARHGIELEVVE